MPRSGEPAFVFCLGSGSALHAPPTPGPCVSARIWPWPSRETQPQGSPLTPLGANPRWGEHPGAGASCWGGSVLSSANLAERS